MGDAGSPYGRFTRGLLSGNPTIALAAAAEVGRLTLPDALQLVILLRDTRHDAFDRYAARWVGRWLEETAGVTLGELRGVTAGLAHPDPGLAARQLERVFRGRRQAALEAVVSRWADGLFEARTG
jgi:hypothetical protein